MKVTCQQCGKEYDDATSLKFCPHAEFLSAADFERKIAGMSLLGKMVVFRSHPERISPARVLSVDYLGYVTLEGFSGVFVPSILEVTKE